VNSCAEKKIDLISTVISSFDQARVFFLRQDSLGTTSLVLSTACARGNPSFGVVLPGPWTWTSA
jgi:hypothetical protein